MTPKSRKYVDQERHDNFSCKHENTHKSMEIQTLWNYFWSLTVVIACVPLDSQVDQFACLIYFNRNASWILNQYSVTFIKSFA